uniref:Uncharacterized protein n=1 Tax=Anguilla anguilla TaxID=7936 RepID=A0A0E9UWS8_ANGAN
MVSWPLNSLRWDQNKMQSSKLQISAMFLFRRALTLPPTIQ